MALPFLPGNSFRDPTKTRFHVAQSLSYKNGYALPLRPQFGVGGNTLPLNQLDEADLDELSNTRPSLTYGNSSKPAPVEFIPAHVAFDKKVLQFDAYFKQTVHESPNEHYRIRDVKFYYYLEDDSMSVVEPAIENSGIPQGKLIKRQRLPKNDLGDCWHWKDLNLDIDVTLYGKVFHIYSCDQWTAEFMQSEGIELNSAGQTTSDPYIETRHKPQPSHTTPSAYDKLKQFLELDRNVLRFYSVWDDRDNMFGEMRPYEIHYYLADDTVQIREIHEANDGRDPFPVLLCRQKLPKDRDNMPSTFPTSVLEVSDHEIKEWFSPKDFTVGKAVNIMGRRFLIHDCDDFTKAYYRSKFGVQEFQSVQVSLPSPKPAELEIQPYNGFGSLEDSKQSCLTLIPQPPKKDVMKMLENDGKILRFAARMESTRPEDKNRKFIISYRLADEMVTIYEPPQRNAGILGGKFLERTRVAKPGSSTDNPDFYTPGDFAIGATVHAFKHKFIITDADEYAVKYMEARADQFPAETIQSLKEKRNGKTV